MRPGVPSFAHHAIRNCIKKIVNDNINITALFCEKKKYAHIYMIKIKRRQTFNNAKYFTNL